MHVFDSAEIGVLVESFCERIPKLLAEHSVTADLVPRVVGLGEQAQTPFTVAIVGPMRVGKSSLINAILEKDLAETGVTETTATINWIHYGDDPSQVRIHWKDRPPEVIPRAELINWTGDSQNAANTRYIELFDNAAFLKVASIVDTPGLRSVIGGHTDATENFLGLRCENESRAIGSQADAIVYVLMPVARESDDSFLATFLDQTQLPGSASFNSLVVLHKWETLESEDPVAESKSKAARVAKALGESVAAVIPVSAPLSWATNHLPGSQWQNILAAATSTPADELAKMLRGERRFVREVPGCEVSVADRTALLSAGLPWPSLKLIVSIASDPSIVTIDQLRETVADIGQVNFLRAELDRRFFARSRSLKVLSTVAKAWEPCQLAQLRLRQRRMQTGEQLASSRGIVSLIADRVQQGDEDLAAVQNYVLTTQEALRREHQALTDLLNAVSHEVTGLKTIYDDYVGDLAGLEWLGGFDSSSIAGDERKLLESIFGGKGTSVAERLSTLRQGSESALDAVEEAIEFFSNRRHRSRGETKVMLAHAIVRLEQLANQLESEVQEFQK